MRAAEALAPARDVEQLRLAVARRPRLRPLEDRAHGLAEPRLRDVHGARDELVAALVRNTDHRSVDAELLDDRLGHRVRASCPARALCANEREIS